MSLVVILFLIGMTFLSGAVLWSFVRLKKLSNNPATNKKDKVLRAVNGIHYIKGIGFCFAMITCILSVIICPVAWHIFVEALRLINKPNIQIIEINGDIQTFIACAIYFASLYAIVTLLTKPMKFLMGKIVERLHLDEAFVKDMKEILGETEAERSTNLP